MAAVNDKVLVFGADMLEVNEAVAADGSSITAGDVLEQLDDGTVQEHSTDGGAPGPGSFVVALDARRKGMELGGTYEPGEAVRLARVRGGSVHLRLAQDESVSMGDALVSAGDGTVRAAATDGTEDSGVLAFVNEASEDTTASGTDAVTYTPVLPQ